MGSASSVGHNFVQEEYRKQLAYTLEEEVAKHGVKKEVAGDIASKLYSKGAELAREQSFVYRGTSTFVCAVDGSDASHLAFKATKLLLKKKDHICIFHAFKPELDEQKPAHMKSETIKHKYQTDLVGSFPSGKYSFLWEDKKDCQAKELIIKLSDLYGQLNGGVKPEFLVLGYTGRKGIHKTEGATTIGSTSDFALRSIHLPTILIKNEVPTGPKSYIMAIDESKNSKTGLDMIFPLIRPQDSLTVIHIYDVENTAFGAQSEKDETAQYYENELNEHAPTTNAKFHPIMKAAEGIAATINEYVNEIVPDFFCMAPRAQAEKGITSLTEKMILELKCNIILCKH